MTEDAKRIGVFSEDGWKAEVEILKDTSDEEWHRYDLKVLRTLRESRIFIAAVDGTVFHVEQLKNGAWCGMWHLEETP